MPALLPALPLQPVYVRAALVYMPVLLGSCRLVGWRGVCLRCHSPNRFGLSTCVGWATELVAAAARARPYRAAFACCGCGVCKGLTCAALCSLLTPAPARCPHPSPCQSFAQVTRICILLNAICAGRTGTAGAARSTLAIAPTLPSTFRNPTAATRWQQRGWQQAAGSPPPPCRSGECRCEDRRRAMQPGRLWGEARRGRHADTCCALQFLFLFHSQTCP